MISRFCGVEPGMTVWVDKGLYMITDMYLFCITLRPLSPTDTGYKYSLTMFYNYFYTNCELSTSSKLKVHARPFWNKVKIWFKAMWKLYIPICKEWS